MLTIMRRLFIISFPLSIIALFILTAKGEMTFADGPNVNVIGFPFLWAMDGVNSMSLEIAFLPLIGNFLLYLLVTSLIFIPTSKHFRKAKLIGTILWSISILVCIIVGILSFIDPNFSIAFKFPEESELINYHFTFLGIL